MKIIVFLITNTIYFNYKSQTFVWDFFVHTFFINIFYVNYKKHI